MKANPTNANRLGEETSPYLLQHKDNPVHWRPWGPEAFAEAKSAGKPVLLSVGYAACHWCHVMAHESFENAAIAALMNEHFVSIKLDREERPDLDAIYQAALALLGQPGGWPLTMFLTPAGEPFWGGTYFPPEGRWGRPGFAEVLRQMADIYGREPDKVGKNVAAIRQALEELANPKPAAGTVDAATLDRIAHRLLEQVDPMHGGIGAAPKFPQCAIFELLWRAWKRTGDARFKDAVTRTLTRMCQGGIYDHVGGGFARYAVDREWLVPHFEKMLYDNALLLEQLTLVWQETRDPLFAERVRETAAWALREMRAKPGASGRRGFAGSLDADSEGEEGRFYVWSESDIDAVLGANAPAFKEAYGVSAAGNWEGHNILNRLARPALRAPAEEARLGAARARLFEARRARPRPGWDDKVLADWNGLMVAALAHAAAAFAEPPWLAAAEEAFAFVCEDMTVEGRLRHSWRHRLHHPATLDDYANMCRAALALLEATGNRRYLAQAEAWVAVVLRHYADREGGYFVSADDTGDVIVRNRSASDGATPAGAATLLGVFARLFHLTGDERWRERAESLLAASSGEVERNAFGLATLLNNVELLQRAVQIVVVGAPGDADTEALVRAVYERSLPNRVLSVVAPGTSLPAGHPAAGKTAMARPAAFVCRGPTCSLPISDPAGLSRALAHG